MRIPEETINIIRQSADIVEVVGDFVTLKKRGANLIACCPFHNEKTPSFYVSPAKGIYKCFGCGKSGDSLRFVMDVENITYPEAIRQLAKKYGIEIKEIDPTPDEIIAQNERESLHIVLEFANDFFQKQLFESEEGRSIGLSYFKERGFNEKTIKNFELGYSLDQWDKLLNASIARGFQTETLKKAGLIVQKDEGKTFDYFRGRVMFPIHGLAGKVVAFGARVLKKDIQPKYLNSPETDVYHKSNLLYGIFQAKQSIRQLDMCYLVEGYTDVVSLHQAGIHNVVASSGTSLTAEQIRLIGRFTKNITILYDGDTAGIKASLRGIDLILEEGLNVHAVTFPDSEDPDSYVRKMGGDAFQKYLQGYSQDFISFKTSILVKDIGNDPLKKAGMIRELVESVSKIPDSIKRTVFFQRVAQQTGIAEDTLIQESNKIFRQNQQQKQKEQQRQGLPTQAMLEATIAQELSQLIEPIQPNVTKQSPIFHQEQECLRLLVCYGTTEIEKGITLADYVLHELRGIEFITPIFSGMLQTCRESHEKGEILLTQHYLANPIFQETVIDFVAEKHQLSDNWKNQFDIYVPLETDKLHDAAFTNILRLKKHYNDLRMQEAKKELIQTSNVDDQMIILAQIQKMQHIAKAIANELGIVVVR